MENFKGVDGEVFTKMHGRWEKIGDVEFVSINIGENDTPDDVADKLNSGENKLDDFESVIELDIPPDDREEMYRFVYYHWLGQEYPTLFWN